jgi:hypothetical protein
MPIFVKYYVCKNLEMMKRIVIACCCLLMISIRGMAQHRPPEINTYSDEDPDWGKGFRKDHIFIGGSLNLGFSGYVFNVGGAPEIGYSINKWLDAGVIININYTSERADSYYNGDVRTRIYNYGTGAFARFYPLPFLFLQAEPEYNWTKYTQRYMGPGSYDLPSYNQQAASFLLGIGYGQRFVGHSSYYIAIMFDALSNYGSPYRDLHGVALPVLKAGFDFYLHPKKRG